MTVAALVYPGCTLAEIVTALTRLRSSGINVVFVAVDRAPFRDSSGLLITPDCEIRSIDVSTLSAIIVPGGDPGSIIGDESVRRLLREINSTCIIAGICAGVLVLADAGVLASRHITHNYRSPWASEAIESFVAPLLDGTIVEDDRERGVVQDDMVITALPNAAAEFTVTICTQLGALAPAQAPLLLRHIRGEFVNELFDD